MDEERHFEDLSSDELIEMQLEDPVSYARILANHISSNVQQSFLNDLEEQRYQDAVVRTYEEFEKANPEFGKMWDSGELHRFIEKNPTHNPLSAYYMLTEGREPTREMHKQKNPETDTDERLLNPEEHGGIDKVLYQRHAERMNRRNAGKNRDSYGY